MIPTTTELEQLLEIREAWIAEPALFFRNVLGFKPWKAQRRIATSVMNGPKSRTFVKSGHKIGKSRVDAALALMWPVVHPGGQVLITAPSGHQIKNILWPEVRKLHREALFSLGGHVSPDPFRGWTNLPDGGGIICVSTDDPERLAGVSSPNMLVIVDEGSGFDPELWAPLHGNLGGGGHLLSTGNPTQMSGEFYEAFSTKAGLCNTVTVSSATTPNVRHGDKRFPGLATRQWLVDEVEYYTGVRIDGDAPHDEILEQLEEVQDRSPFIGVRILGRFSMSGVDTCISLSLVEKAEERWPDTEGEGQLVIGVDPARFGDDDSVLAPRRGLRFEEVEEHKQMDGQRLADACIKLAKKLRRPEDEKLRPRFVVDAVGLGASCYDFLAARKRTDGEIQFELASVNTGETADDPEQYANLRAQLHFGFADWLRDGGALPPNGKLRAELVAAKYKLDARQRRVVEKKGKIKERLRRSPDRGDACMLSVYRGRSLEPEFHAGEADATRWGDYDEERGFG